MENVKEASFTTEDQGTPAGCIVHFTQNSDGSGKKIKTNQLGAWVRGTRMGISAFATNCSGSEYVLAFRNDDFTPEDYGVVLPEAPLTSDGLLLLKSVTGSIKNDAVKNDHLGSWLIGKTGHYWDKSPGNVVVPLYSVNRSGSYTEKNTFNYGGKLPPRMSPSDTGWKIGNANDAFNSAVATGAVCPLPEKHLDKTKSGLVPGFDGKPTSYVCSYPVNDEEVVAKINEFRNRSDINALRDGRAVALKPIVDLFCENKENQQKPICSYESTGTNYSNEQDQLDWCLGVDTVSTKKVCPETYPLEYTSHALDITAKKMEYKRAAEEQYEGTWEVTKTEQIGSGSLYKFTLERTDDNKFDNPGYSFNQCLRERDESGNNSRRFATLDNIRAWNGTTLASTKCTKRTEDNQLGLLPQMYETMWKVLCKDNPHTRGSSNCTCWANYQQSVFDSGGENAIEGCKINPKLCGQSDAAVDRLNAFTKKIEETAGLQMNKNFLGWESNRYCYEGSGCKQAASTDDPKIYSLDKRYNCTDNIQVCLKKTEIPGVISESNYTDIQECKFISSVENKNNIDVVPPEEQGTTTSTSSPSPAPGPAPGPDSDEGLIDKIEAFFKKWWWVILIVVIVVVGAVLLSRR